MPKPEITPNRLLLKFPNISKIQGFPSGTGEGRLGVMEEWVPPPPPPYVAQFCWFPSCNGLPSLYIKEWSPHHLNESAHQWVSPFCPIVCRGVSCTKSLPCPLCNKFFAILYNSLKNCLFRHVWPIL